VHDPSSATVRASGGRARASIERASAFVLGCGSTQQRVLLRCESTTLDFFLDCAALACRNGAVRDGGRGRAGAGGGARAADLESLRQACRKAVEVPFDAWVGSDESLGHLRAWR
jgi:hypothetical protein